jgi:hypothetical protein
MYDLTSDTLGPVFADKDSLHKLKAFMMEVYH